MRCAARQLAKLLFAALACSQTGCGYVKTSSLDPGAWDRPGAAVEGRPESGFFEAVDLETSARKVFYSPPGGGTPIKIYTHERGVMVRLGNTGRLAFINDYFASKAGMVLVVDLAAGRSRRIDEKAREMHSRNAPPEWLPGYQIPEARAVSPDDSAVLIVMEHEFGVAIRRERWSYVVDAQTGEVRKCFRTDGMVPRRWWE